MIEKAPDELNELLGFTYQSGVDLPHARYTRRCGGGAMCSPTSTLRGKASAANAPGTHPLRCRCGAPRRGRHDSPGHCHTCHATWRGVRAAHCAACHRTFTSASAFDAHQRGVDAVRCLDPATVGLVQRTDRLWRMARQGERDGRDDTHEAA